MTGTLRTYVVSSEFWNAQPEAAAQLLAAETRKHPDDLWMIVIGNREDAHQFIETQLFHFPRAVDVEPT